MGGSELTSAVRTPAALFYSVRPLFTLFTFFTLGVTNVLHARDYVSIAGSSTVLPFATIIAEELGNNPMYKTPVVESGGSSVGKKVYVKALEQSLLILVMHHLA